MCAKGDRAEIRQLTDAKVAGAQVELALLDVFRAHFPRRFGFQEQSMGIVPDDEIRTPPRHFDSIVAKRYFGLADGLQPEFAQFDFQRPLVVYFHAVGAKLPLDGNARAEDLVGQWLKLVTHVLPLKGWITKAFGSRSAKAFGSRSDEGSRRAGSAKAAKTLAMARSFALFALRALRVTSRLRDPNHRDPNPLYRDTTKSATHLAPLVFARLPRPGAGGPVSGPARTALSDGR